MQYRVSPDCNVSRNGQRNKKKGNCVLSESLIIVDVAVLEEEEFRYLVGESDTSVWSSKLNN